MQLRELKQYNVDGGDLESLVEMLAYGTMILGTYRNLEDDGVEIVPEWIEPKMKKIRREIVNKNEDILRKRLADAKLRLEQHKSPTERKREAQKEIQRLQELVGQD